MCKLDLFGSLEQQTSLLAIRYSKSENIIGIREYADFPVESPVLVFIIRIICVTKGDGFIVEYYFERLLLRDFLELNVYAYDRNTSGEDDERR